MLFPKGNGKKAKGWVSAYIYPSRCNGEPQKESISYRIEVLHPSRADRDTIMGKWDLVHAKPTFFCATSLKLAWRGIQVLLMLLAYVCNLTVTMSVSATCMYCMC